MSKYISWKGCNEIDIVWERTWEIGRYQEVKSNTDDERDRNPPLLPILEE